MNKLLLLIFTITTLSKETFSETVRLCENLINCACHWHNHVKDKKSAWLSALKAKRNRKKLGKLQRRALLRVISVYRTVSEITIQVVATVPTIGVLVGRRTKEDILIQGWSWMKGRPPQESRLLPYPVLHWP